jgi:hypothetical protein
MGVGLIDLIARGNKDVWLHNNPNRAYFLKSFRKYINSITETRVLPFNNANFGKKTKVTIPNFCDMYSKLILEIKFSDFFGNQEINGYTAEEFLTLYEPLNTEDNFGLSNYLIFDLIEKIDLYAGKLKIDSYNSYMLFNNSVENTTLTTKTNLLGLYGYAKERYMNLSPGIDNSLLIRLPFDLVQPTKPLPTHLCRNSPLEIRIQYRKLEDLLYPRQLNPYRNITFVNKSNSLDTVNITLQRPYLKETLLHITGVHLPVNVIQDMLKSKERLKTHIRPFVTYDTQSFNLIDAKQPELTGSCCTGNFGVKYRVPNNGETSKIPFPLEFQNPIQTFHIYLNKRNNDDRLDFNISNDVSNVNILTKIGLNIHGEVIYPELDSRFYTRVTPYLTKGETILNKTFYLPLNLYNKNMRNNYGFINYAKVNHSTMNFEFLGWETNDSDRSFNVTIIAKVYKKLEISYGSIKFHADF